MRNIPMHKLACATFAFACLSFAAHAHMIEKGGVQIIHPWAKPAQGGATDAFPTISNEGKSTLTLTKVETPVAQRVELKQGGRTVQKPGDVVAFDGKAFGMTLVGLRQPLVEGANFPATFHFSGSHTAIDLRMVVGEKSDLPVDGAKVNLTHDPIPQIGWPRMTMDMALLDEARIGEVKPGERAWLVFAIGKDGVYGVKEIAPRSGPKPVAHGGDVLAEGVVHSLP
jgi:copper(I)-binding protein